MKLETFFDKFDLFADAPDAVPKMRELVLRLAMQGKLSEPQEGDVPVSELLRDVHAEKKRLGVESSIDRSRETSEIPDGKTIASIPERWKWVRFGTIARHNAGKTLDKGRNTGELRDYITTSNLYWGFFKLEKIRQMPIQADELERCTARKGDLLICEGGEAGRAAVWPYDYEISFQNHIHRARFYGGINPYFVYRYFEKLNTSGEINSYRKGVGISNMSGRALASIFLPLPPLAEQKRIVVKVDELMASCDQLEAQQQKREIRRGELSRASLARFAEAPTPANLNLLFHPSYAIVPSDLRKSILTLAVHGKLVRQDPNDVPQVFPTAESVADEDRDFEIPETWNWRELGQIGMGSTGKTPPTNDSANYGGDIPFIGPGQINPAGEILPSDKFLTEKGIQFGTEARVGDVLMVCIGGSIGKAAICRSRLSFNQQINAVRPEKLTTEFAFIAFSSAYFQKHVHARATGSATPIINRSKWESIPVPVPPLAEQHRIVRKVQQLRFLVDGLETQLVASCATAANLLNALVAELTGKVEISNRPESSKGTVTMKAKADAPAERRDQIKPLKLSTKSFVLRRFAMSSGYRSLGKFDCKFHTEKENAGEASPICLVGLNGSGKSNLIEAVAEVFCFLELINLPWKKVASRSSRFRENSHRFQLDYTLEDEKGERLIRIKKTKNSGAEFFVVNSDDSEEPIEAGRPQLLVLPRRIVGYSSGLNETVSHPFLRTKTIYSEEVRDAAPPEGVEPSTGDSVFDTRTLYMDYESNAAILIANYIFCKSEELAVFEEFTRVRSVASFGLRFNQKRAGRSGPHKIVRLTDELQSYLESFSRCAGAKLDTTQLSRSLNFELTPKTIRLIREEFKTAETLFMAMHKWSLLNALILSDQQRNVYLSNDITKGALERPPSVPPSDRVFNIVDLRLNLSTPEIEIDYSGLSDGEHQFVQVFGTALLFSEPGTLFLFDEPESHFNPEWRTKFNLILNRLPNASRQEYIISTHSPFIVSGSRMGNVYKFMRNGAEITIDPVKFETYGASFDDLLKKLFSVDSLIDQSAREELEEIIKEGDVGKMQDAVEDFAESKEKRRLYEALIQKGEG